MTERHTVDTITSDALDSLYDERDLLRSGVIERSALLEEARDALEAAGITEVHGGDSWPRLASAIEELAKRAGQAEDLLRVAHETSNRSEAERARAAAVVARVRQMATYWEQNLPEAIRTPAVVSALRAATDPAR